jgi:predicted deacylase
VSELLAADFEGAAVTGGTIVRGFVPFAHLPDGNPLTFPLIVIAGQAAGPTAALIGGIHGDEYEGPSALMRLADAINPRVLRGRLFIVPFANLAAFGAGTRSSPIDRANLARIFPGDSRGTLSFRLAHALMARVVEGSDFLVDCHSGGTRLAFLDVAGFYVAGEGVNEVVASHSLALAKAMGLGALWRLPPRSGVLSYEAVRRGIPAVGAEIGGRGGCLPTDSNLYLNGLRRILADRGMIDRVDLAPAPVYRTYFDGDWQLAPTSGFIESDVDLGARVAMDQRLATIRSPLGRLLCDLCAKQEGVVMGVRHLRTIAAGEWATCVVVERML